MADKNQTKEVKAAIITAIPASDLIERFSGRKKLLELTDSLIEETYNRVTGDRFRVREGDRERLAYLRTLVSLILMYDSLLKGSNAPELDGINQATINRRMERAKQMSDMFDF